MYNHTKKVYRNCNLVMLLFLMYYMPSLIAEDKQPIIMIKHTEHSNISTALEAGMGALAGGFCGFIVSAILIKKISKQSCLYIPVHGPYDDKHMYLRWAAFGATISGVGTWLLINWVNTDNKKSPGS